MSAVVSVWSRWKEWPWGLVHRKTPDPATRPKDEADFLAVHAVLTDSQREWLARSLALVSPTHPWLARL